jgi:hypothetical protein
VLTGTQWDENSMSWRVGRGTRSGRVAAPPSWATVTEAEAKSEEHIWGAEYVCHTPWIAQALSSFLGFHPFLLPRLLPRSQSNHYNPKLATSVPRSKFCTADLRANPSPAVGSGQHLAHIHTHELSPQSGYQIFPEPPEVSLCLCVHPPPRQPMSTSYHYKLISFLKTNINGIT